MAERKRKIQSPGKRGREREIRRQNGSNRPVIPKRGGACHDHPIANEGRSKLSSKQQVVGQRKRFPVNQVLPHSDEGLKSTLAHISRL